MNEPVLTPIVIRPAHTADITELRALIESSVRALQRNDYTADQIERALATAYGVDTQLIDDGTYFVAIAANDPAIVGAGGWSKRRKLYGGDRSINSDNGLLDPVQDAAKIRAFFVHPACARRGIGSRILIHCEAAARVAGFTRFEIGATLTGIPLYMAHGYRVTATFDLALGEDAILPIAHMEKTASL